MINEGPDGYDAVEWLAGQRYTNGRVGMIGSSYLGWTQRIAAAQNLSHLLRSFPTFRRPIRSTTPRMSTELLISWVRLCGLESRSVQHSGAVTAVNRGNTLGAVAKKKRVYWRQRRPARSGPSFIPRYLFRFTCSNCDRRSMPPVARRAAANRVFTPSDA